MTTTQAPVSLASRITQLVDDDEIQLPPLPALAIKLQRLIAGDDADARTVAELIKTEPAVVTSLMRVANSVAFGGLREVSDLSQAIARLGLKQVGTITSGLLLKGHFVSKPTMSREAYLRTLWDHSVATAFCSRQFAAKVGEDPEQAFMAGLLHDVGKLVVIKGIDLLLTRKLEVQITENVECEMLEALHCKLGHHTLTRWKLPEPLCSVVLHHEDPVESSAGLLLICVQAAELIAKKMGYHEQPEPDHNLIGEPAIEALGIGDVELAEMMIDLEDEFEEVHKLF